MAAPERDVVHMAAPERADVVHMAAPIQRLRILRARRKANGNKGLDGNVAVIPCEYIFVERKDRVRCVEK